MRKTLQNLFFLILLCSTKTVVAQRIFLVDADKPQNTMATGVASVNATAWEMACGNLATAMAAAGTFDQVWVKAGSYNLAGSGTFFTKPYGKYYGHFGGWETSLAQRELSNVVNKTVISGAYFFINQQDDNTVIDGFTFTGPSGSNGVIFCNNAFPTISNCIFENLGNPNSPGTVIFAIYSFPRISNCIFRNNDGGTTSILYTMYSGAILTACTFLNNKGRAFVNTLQNPNTVLGTTLTNCSFSGNQVNQSGSGGALTVMDGALTDVSGCTFSNNSNQQGLGGAVSSLTGIVRISGSVFSGNSSQRGGAIYSNNSSTRLSASFVSGNSATLEGGGVYGDGQIFNTVITDNTAGNGGGGVANPGSVINCTIAKNTSQQAGGGISGAGEIKNSIIWGNNATDEPEQADVNAGSTVFLNNLIGKGYTGTNNYQSDPRFVDIANALGADGISGTADDGLRIWPCSPAVNAGNNAAVSQQFSKDVSGAKRIYGSLVDIGAYELEGSAEPDGILAEDQQVSTRVIGSGEIVEYHVNNAGCKTVANIQSTGENPVQGNVVAKVWVNETPPANFVKRHYEIKPDNGYLTATGKVTLYFTQKDFDDFNDGNSKKLPINSTDLDNNKSNLLIEKRSGFSSDGTGSPGSYLGATAVDINPLAANGSIIWNEAAKRWEISFDVDGFSGFFVKTSESPLPLRLLTFTGNQENSNHKLSWQTADEVNTAYFEVQSSRDAQNFQPVARIRAVGNGANRYSLNDPITYPGTVYYRLKMIDLDETFAFSRMVYMEGSSQSKMIIYPNPVSDQLKVGQDGSLTGSTVHIYHINGNLVQKEKISSIQHTISVKSLMAGVYIIKFENGTQQTFIRE
jgi:hypothetical protein